mmetsp:Transcript_12768/g.41753  ORF Transcript_12768/g.41753 Transcript_12768/m.41753 type:complete len:188 (-) Transcript_12768:383-946(-)
MLAQACAVHMRLPMVIAVTKPPMTSSPNAVIYKHTRPTGGVHSEEMDLYVSSEVLTPSGSLLILDDVLASGKTAAGCVDLVEQCATPAPMPQPSSATGFRQRTAHRRPCRRLRMAMVVLASGGAADLPRPTLFRVHRSGAKVKGCGFLIEKMHDGGRASLPRDALVVAVVRVQSVTDGHIVFCEERA